MTIDSWLQALIADFEKRGLPELKPLLEGLAQATRVLRDADFNESADGRRTADNGPSPPSSQTGSRC
jgi:hypothetical protein